MAVLFMAALGTPLWASAQARQNAPFNLIGFSTGATTMSVDAINAGLTRANFAGLSNDGISYGATGYLAIGRALLGADYSRTTFGEEGLNNGRTDDLNAMQILGTASYAIWSTSRFSMFPALGVGVGQFDVTLRDRAGGSGLTMTSPTFAEVTATPGTSSTVSGHHLLFSAGGGADYLITRGTSTDVGVVFGVRAGFYLAPNRTTWTMQGRDVLAGPDASAGGPFLRVIIGIGGR